MGEQGYAGFDERVDGLRVVVLNRPWRLRSPQPVAQALAEVSGLGQEVADNSRSRRYRGSPELREGRAQGLQAGLVLLVVAVALCLLPAVVEVAALVLVWPFWVLALRLVPRMPRTVEVRRGRRLVHTVRARDEADAAAVVADLRRRLAAGQPLDPEPTDFSDLLVRPRRRRR